MVVSMMASLQWELASVSHRMLQPAFLLQSFFSIFVSMTILVAHLLCLGSIFYFFFNEPVTMAIA